MWERIRLNKRRSTILIAVMGVLLITLGYAIGEWFFNNTLAGIGIAFVVWVLHILTAYYKGDRILLALSRAKKIGYDDHPRLYNIVEEMKLASGLGKMPDIYIIDDPALNAFASGRDEEHMAIAITTGLLRKLDRDELQGVIGHEIAHIRNYDILLMSLAGVLLGTMEFLLWYGPRNLVHISMASDSSRAYESSSRLEIEVQIITAMLTFVFFFFLLLIPVFARIIYFAVSREREYLADASSALYTRYPEGLASALEKLGRSTGRLRSATRATAPMYIVNPSRKGNLQFFSLSRTHPPLHERIRILRGMAGVSYNHYEDSYREVYGSSYGIIPASGLAALETSLTGLMMRESSDDPGRVVRARDATNAVWRASNYSSIVCECGARLRIPPGKKNAGITCPRCRRRHSVRRRI